MGESVKLSGALRKGLLASVKGRVDRLGDGVVRVYGGGGEGSIGVQDTKSQLEALERLVVTDVEE